MAAGIVCVVVCVCVCSRGSHHVCWRRLDARALCLGSRLVLVLYLASAAATTTTTTHRHVQRL